MKNMKKRHFFFINKKKKKSNQKISKKKIKLRIRNKDKNFIIETLNEQSMFKELTETISNLTGIPPLHQECMKKGFYEFNYMDHIHSFFHLINLNFFLVKFF